MKPIIYWFEDQFNEIEKPVSQTEKLLSRVAKVLRYDLTDGDRVQESYRNQVIDKLKPDMDSIYLIICDDDLSSSAVMPGLTADPIERIARDQGIPLAVYSKGKIQSSAVSFQTNQGFSERKFVLKAANWKDDQNIPNSIRDIFLGCREIRDFVTSSVYGAAASGRQKKKLPESGTPSIWMSRLLKRPELEPRLSLYSSGDQKHLESLIQADPSDQEKYSRTLATELSYWLWESILRFPGILLNEIAASSFLNIALEEFRETEIQKVFNSARYKGPFSKVNQYWWRDKLQFMIDRSESESGRDFISNKIRREVKSCKCSVDETIDAGYYCMVTNRPVSDKNSKGNIPFFPKGADIARVSNAAMNRISPWAGVSI